MSLFFVQKTQNTLAICAGDDTLTLKRDFILFLCELIIGGKEGLEPVEKTIIDRCVRLVYREFLVGPEPRQF
ncbi:MAG: hypothetical protein LBU32_31055 [Clostridiales bacterium]|nr:hypothetical protein [Clostridiales bacterium]